MTTTTPRTPRSQSLATALRLATRTGTEYARAAQFVAAAYYVDHAERYRCRVEEVRR